MLEILKNFCGIVALSVFLAAPALALDAPCDFAQSRGGELSPWGLPGLNSSPARKAEAGFGASYYELPSAEQSVFALAGDFYVQRFRGAFLGTYFAMDSLYRQIYTEWDGTLDFDWFIIGAGYGLSVEWIPGDETWARHRYKLGNTFAYKDVYLSALVWNFTTEPLQDLRYLLGFYIRAGNHFDCFVQWDGESTIVGSILNFQYMSLMTSYRLPTFSMALTLTFHFGSWNMEGVVGNSSQTLEWFGGGFEKKISKKTIL